MIFHIQANNGAGSGAVDIQFNPALLDADGNYHWERQSPTEIQDGSGRTLGTLSNASVSYLADPQVSLAFAVTAASSDTTFTITSALLSFPSISPAQGRATAGVTVTDLDGDGASMFDPNGRAIYRANYNGLVPGGTSFTSFFTSVNAGSFSTGTDSGEFPAGAGNFQAIGVPVSSMSAQFSFTLSANDSASGTSTWVVIPAPGVMGLLTVAGVAGLRRRRR